jgi:DNA-binding NarL/FixJ family response regulator
MTVSRPTEPGREDVEVLAMLAQGLGIEVIARRQQVSERTVRRRIRMICDKLAVQTPLQAAVWAARRDLI